MRRYGGGMNQGVGKRARVDPRSLWPNDARDFTPWLAENIGLLGGAIGLELEVLKSDADVVVFSLDILVRDLGRDRVVVIANQLKATDHSHLGRLITYPGSVTA